MGALTRQVASRLSSRPPPISQVENRPEMGDSRWLNPVPVIYVAVGFRLMTQASDAPRKQTAGLSFSAGKLANFQVAASPQRVFQKANLENHVRRARPFHFLCGIECL